MNSTFRERHTVIPKYLTEVRIDFNWWQGKRSRLRLFDSECEQVEKVAQWKTYSISTIMRWSHDLTVTYNFNTEQVQHWVKDRIKDIKSITLKKLLSE